MSSRKLALSLLTACLLGTPLPTFAEETTQVTENIQNREEPNTDWSSILSRYVHANPDGVNRFDYGALRANLDDVELLNGYIETLAGSKLSALPRDEKFAAYANLYNALTIRLVVENYPIDSITKIRPSLFAVGPWKKDLVTVEGKDLSLDDIEHDILRKEFDDPRVHYAINCASMGCPNLQPEAWTADTLDAGLEAAARDYINHPRGVTIRSDGRLQISTIYRWFKEDFGGNEEGVIAHLLKFADDGLTMKIKANPDIADHKYDWSLNDTE